MSQLIREWTLRADALKAQADDLVAKRNHTSKYYSSMTPDEKKEFDSILEAESRLRIQYNQLVDCTRELTAYFTSAA